MLSLLISTTILYYLLYHVLKLNPVYGHLTCGLFGFSGKQPVDKTKIRWLAIENESRGRHSTGLYTERSDKHKTKHLVKDTDTASIYVDKPEFNEAISGALLVQGHTRSATAGAVTKANAHPFEYDYTDEGGARCIGAHNGFVYEKGNGGVKQFEFFGFEKDFVVDSELIFATLAKYGTYEKLSEIVGAVVCSFSFPDKYPGLLFIYKGSGRDLHVGRCKEGIYYSSERQPLKYIGCSAIMTVPDNSVMILKDGIVLDVEELKPLVVKVPFGTQRGGLEEKLAPLDLKKLGIEKTSTPISTHSKQWVPAPSKAASSSVNRYATSDDYVENQFKDKLAFIIDDIKKEVDKLEVHPLDFVTSQSAAFTDIDSCLLLLKLQSSTKGEPALAGWTVFDVDKNSICGITALNGVCVLQIPKEECNKPRTFKMCDPLDFTVFSIDITPKDKSVLEVALSIPFPQGDANASKSNKDVDNTGIINRLRAMGETLLRVHTTRLVKRGSILPTTTKNSLDVQLERESVHPQHEGKQVSGNEAEQSTETSTGSGHLCRVKAVHSGKYLGTGKAGEPNGVNNKAIPAVTPDEMKRLINLENSTFTYKNDILKLIKGQEYSHTLSQWKNKLGEHLNIQKLLGDAAVLKLNDVRLHGQAWSLGFYAYRIICQFALDKYELRRTSSEDTVEVYRALGDLISIPKQEEIKKNSPVMNEEMSLSFYKELVYYIATITANVEKFMYTPEKKLAIAKALGSQGHLVENQLDKLKFVQDKLEAHGTLKDLGLKEAVNEVVKGLKYQNLLISQFRTELNT